MSDQPEGPPPESRPIEPPSVYRRIRGEGRSRVDAVGLAGRISPETHTTLSSRNRQRHPHPPRPPPEPQQAPTVPHI